MLQIQVTEIGFMGIQVMIRMQLYQQLIVNKVHQIYVTNEMTVCSIRLLDSAKGRNALLDALLTFSLLRCRKKEAP